MDSFRDMFDNVIVGEATVGTRRFGLGSTLTLSDFFFLVASFLVVFEVDDLLDLLKASGSFSSSDGVSSSANIFCFVGWRWRCCCWASLKKSSFGLASS